MLLLWPSIAQNNSGVVTVAPLGKARVKRGQQFTETVKVAVKPGFHVNSNAPDDEYLIPLKLTWARGPLQAEDVIYPKPEKIRSAFSPKPVLVFTGNFDIVTKFKVASNSETGPNMAAGKLRYQACNDRECLRPQTVDVNLSLDVR